MIDFQHWPESTGLLSFLKSNFSDFREIGSSPFEVLEEAGSIQLRKYLASESIHENKPVLIIPSFINRSFILDLLPEKSFIRHFLDRGHDVYLIDWGVPKGHEKHLTLEALLTVHLNFLIQKIHQDCGGAKVHLIGHCIGGTLSFILSALMHEYFLSLTLLTAPVQFKEKDKLSLWASEPQFDAPAFVEAYGNIPWAITQATFLSLKPLQLWARTQHLLKKVKDKKNFKNTLAMEIWINDNVNLRGQLFKFIIEDLNKNDSIALEKFAIGNRTVDLKKFRLPIFVLASEEDHIVPIANHLRAELVPSAADFQFKSAEGGHVGALISSRSQKTLWPAMTEWMAKIERRVDE
jgi:polyhydroxyalkanoate synthase